MILDTMREKIKNLPPPGQCVIGGGLAVLIFLGLTFRLCAPLWAQRAAVLAQYRQEQARLDQVERFVLAHPDSEVYVRDAAAQAARTDTMLPDAPDVSSFTVLVADMAQRSGVHLSAIKPQSPQLQQGFSRLPVDLTVRGNYQGLLSFLQGLQDLPRYTTIAHVDIHAPSPGAPQLEAKILAEIYTIAPPAETQPGVPAAAPPRVPPSMPLRR